MITVSEIAASAGVGKGTIYDYFESKEEVIKKAILFNFNNEIDYFYKKIATKKGFKEKYYEIFNSIVENLQNKFSTVNILMTLGKLPEFHISEKQDSCEFNKHILRIQAIIDDLLVSGYKEGIIKKIESQYYQNMVIKSSLFSFTNYMSMQMIYKETSVKEAMDAAYKIVIKSLN
nr:TetR/AcrR family transcriptional regulator [Alkalibaculum sporogenes]